MTYAIKLIAICSLFIIGGRCQVPFSKVVVEIEEAPEQEQIEAQPQDNE